MNSLEELAAFLKANDDYILVGHERPDHDSLGSMLALYFGLTKLGKQCRMVSADPLPSNLSWPGLDLIEYIPAGFHPGGSCLIVLDCEPHRTGGLASGAAQAKCLINIDHHQRERGSGDLVYVDPSEAANAVIIYRLLLQLSLPFDQAIATALYGGILGDTGGFRHCNTTAEVLAIAAELLGCGLEPAILAREIFSSQSLGFLRLKGHAFTTLQTRCEGRLAWVALSWQDFQRFGVDPQEKDQLTDEIRTLNTAEIALVFRETAPGQIRVSLRSVQADVGSLARGLGGGGHRMAAGISLRGDLDQIVKDVVAQASECLNAGERDARNS